MPKSIRGPQQSLTAPPSPKSPAVPFVKALRLVGTTVLLASLLAACGVIAPAKPPVASFTMSPSSGVAPLTIDVDASASSDADSAIARYDWAVTGPANAADTGKTARFTLASAGDYTVELTVTDDGGLSDSVSKAITVDPPLVSSAYEIELLFADPAAFTAGERAAFVDAAARWSDVITGNLTEFNLPAMPANYCGAGGEAVSARPVDDLLIQVMLRTLDGPGGLLAFAGPCRARTSGPDNGLPGYGIMVFDEADAAMLATAGTLTATVMHEMGHVLGIGTLWQQNSLLAWEPSGDPCEVAAFTQPPTFNGANAKAGYVVAGGAGDVPVENEGGSGTRCGHWDESYFDNELMTGWIEGAGTPMPISQVTVGSLDDLGYTVSLAAADAFTMPGCAPGCTALKTQGEGGPINEILIYPVPEDLP